jgi:hypothetical protein
MGAYEDALASVSRTPIDVCVVTLDWCANAFGVAPCTATGTPCYNTFPTCKDKANYSRTTKDYTFSTFGAPLPYRTGERPYITEIDYLPTQIDTTLTVSGRLKVYLTDEPDTDVGIDPYVSQRSSVQGSFIKKWLARNPNYKGRMVKVYKGFLGLAFADFKLKGIGKIDTMTRGTTGGSGDSTSLCIECIDLLKDISNVQVPAAVTVKLVTDIDAVVTQFTVDDVSPLPAAPGYVAIGTGTTQEVIEYASLDAVANQLIGCTRGAFNTTVATHKASDKVQPCRYYPPDNPFTHLKTMLLDDAGIDPSYVDTAAFDFWRDWLPCGEPPFSALITSPTTLATLYFEIDDLVDSRSWVAENLLITIARAVPNLPDRAYSPMSDDANIIGANPPTLDTNEASRITEVQLYWDLVQFQDMQKPASYNRLDIAVDSDAESDNEYGDQVPYVFYCRWLRPGAIPDDELQAFVTDYGGRYLIERRDASPLIEIDVELKDYEVSTGAYVTLVTDEVENPDGTPVSANFQVVARDPNYNNNSTNSVHLTLQRANSRVCFIADDNAPDYDSASPDEREYGYICEDDGTMNGSPDDKGYVIF